MLIAPTESNALKALGKSSLLPEKHGVDILFAYNGGWYGIQRKEISDLIASVHDGRLQRELGQMKRLEKAVLLVEGKIQFTMDGELMGKGFGQPWTRKQHMGLLWSVREKGVWVDQSESLTDTIAFASAFEAWVRKGKHHSLDRRPGPVTVWGKPDDTDYACHLVQGLPGMGPELAQRIVQMYGLPFGWKVSREDLLKVPGIGKKTADQLWRSLEGEGVG